MFPFYANYGYNPMFTDVSSIHQSSPIAGGIADHIPKVQEEIKSAMTIAQEQYSCFYNAHHGDTPEFKLDDKVWLETTNIKTDRPSKKLLAKRLGPFKVIEVISTHTYRLALPATMKIHNVFHVSLLTRHKVDTIPGRELPQPPPDIVDGEEFFEVETILNSCYVGNQLQYLIRWVGYDQSEDSWEPIEFLEESPNTIREFHARFPEAWSPAHRLPPQARCQCKHKTW